MRILASGRTMQVGVAEVDHLTVDHDGMGKGDDIRERRCDSLGDPRLAVAGAAEE
ncbi:MAG: hypothetical protein R3C97_06450 [Geminicoccaceae bacterium]